MILVLGTKDSGKSALAEGLMLENSESGKRAYIATMEPYGVEGIKRIKKHRDQRAGKGFVTFEKTTRLYELVDELKCSSINTALLECVSNLVGNEMYDSSNRDKRDEELVNIILEEIMTLDEAMDYLVVVTNDFEDSDEYDADTHRYVGLTGLVNKELIKRADKIYRP